MASLAETADSIARRETGAQALIESARERAQTTAELNALAHVDWPGALTVARRLDDEARQGRVRGPLHGIPVSIKDLFAVRGMPTRAGTRAPLHELTHDVARPGHEEAELVARLRSAGALLFAKTNMHEIALGATGENSWTGDVRNPFDPLRQSGGSSSGAGVAVATGIGLAAIGSDTGGSVRIPAAFCGVTGFKPSFGAIPLEGALPLSWTCDHAGALACSVTDCALLFEVMAHRRVALAPVPRRARLQVPAQWLAGRLAPPVREVFERLLAALAGCGAEIGQVETPRLASAWHCYTPIVRTEAAWVHRVALAAGGEGFSDLVLPALRAGQTVLAGDYVDALKIRAEITTELDAVLAGCDALILPTSPVLPPLRGQLDVEVESGTMTTREAVLGQTLPFSLCGLPTLSIPIGWVDGLPVGLQVVGCRDGDAALLALGQWLEAAVGAEPRHPSAPPRPPSP